MEAAVAPGAPGKPSTVPRNAPGTPRTPGSTGRPREPTSGGKVDKRRKAANRQCPEKKNLLEELNRAAPEAPATKKRRVKPPAAEAEAGSEEGKAQSPAAEAEAGSEDAGISERRGESIFTKLQVWDKVDALKASGVGLGAEKQAAEAFPDVKICRGQIGRWRKQADKQLWRQLSVEEQKNTGGSQTAPGTTQSSQRCCPPSPLLPQKRQVYNSNKHLGIHDKPSKRAII